jgi:hypothetical protein
MLKLSSPLLDTPVSVGESVGWAATVNAAEENGAIYCKGLHGRPLFSALYGTYIVMLHELKAVLKASTIAGQTNLPKKQGNEQRRKVVSKKYGRRSGTPSTKPPEIGRAHV